ncbi:Calcium-transporting ATPase [Bertholletia excelsa]
MVLGGGGRMLVTAVGRNTERIRLTRSLNNYPDKTEESKLQISIDETNSRSGKICVALTLLVLTVHVTRCLTSQSWCQKAHNADPKGMKNAVEEIMNETTKLVKKQGMRANGLVTVLCVFLFSIRDGLPLGVFLSLVCAAKNFGNYHRMEVRRLPSIATAGFITTVIVGETADLALKPSDMADLWVGLERIKINETLSGLDCDFVNTLREGVGLNGSEHSLVLWAEKALHMDLDEVRRTRTVLHTEDFDKKRSGLLLERGGEGGETVHVHWKGDLDKVLPMCSHYYEADGTRKALDGGKRAMFNKIIETILTDGVECIAFAHTQIVKEVKHPSPAEEEEEEEEEEEVVLKPVEEDLTLQGMVSMKNPYSPELRRAVKECQDAGVELKLVVSGDLEMARFTAINSAILEPDDSDMDGKIIEASDFRHSFEEDRQKMATHIRIMANSAASDKLLLLQHLKQKGDQVVAITGTSSWDSPALRAADVGLSLGGVVSESSEIIVKDENFLQICDILKVGRCVCHNLQQFVQLQMTLNIAAFAVNFVITLSYNEEPIGPLELLWVNLIMDILGAQALAESHYLQSPSKTPIKNTDQHITRPAWGYIIVQSLNQIVVLLILYFMGDRFLGTNQKVVKALVFNCFAMCQVFVLISCAFEGMLKQIKCLIFVGAIVALQVALMEVMVVAVEGERLEMRQWWISLGIAGVGLPLGWVARTEFRRLGRHRYNPLL